MASALQADTSRSDLVDLDAMVDLDDGTYDALVVDATSTDDGACRVELTILGGTHKGEVVSLRATGLTSEPLDLLGIPATLTINSGTPSVTFEP
jgi:hypothetical protein